MDYSKAQYVLNAHRLAQLPPDRGAEVAFAGRSNSGKSSAINTITRQKGLARTSKTPGRTQHLVVFELDPDRRLIDLPGFGYAKVPDSVRRHWNATLDDYFRTRESLRGLVLIMDVRHPLKPFDVSMLDWCRQANLPCQVLLSKADKLKRGPAGTTLLEVSGKPETSGWDCQVQLFSAPKHQGVDEVRARLDAWLD
ncbi:MAG: YihA family ribosome biogenesis GTP-binding protein [Gammaproteobacteria bacterium]|nr:MAG: YihA family ribosome biogenesis GTP-binding protein [Gammaproteobacteria bacterium]